MKKRFYLTAIFTILIGTIFIFFNSGDIKTANAGKQLLSNSQFQADSLPGNETAIARKAEKKDKGIFTTKGKDKNKPQAFYPAKEKSGRIGSHGKIPIDNPKDNVFHIYLEDISEIKSAFLTYDLYGLKDQNSVSRSINDGYAMGGQTYEIDTNWKHQQEQIPVLQLKNGDNVIRFSALLNKKYGYSVRNVGIVVNTGNDSKKETKIVLNKVENSLTGDQAFISGKLIGNIPEGKISVLANNKNLTYKNGEFFGYISKDIETKSEGWNIDVTARNNSGWKITEQVHYKAANISQGLTSTSPGKVSVSPSVVEDMEIEFSRSDSLFAELGGASLKLDSGSVNEKTTLSISTLREIDVMPTQSGLVNVTGVHKGYRMLPHGTQFNKPVRIGLPYDSTLIPGSHTKEDIRTYYFDEQNAAWVALPFDTLDAKNGIVYAYSTHFTDFINGVIEVPESPETGGYTPTSIKDLSVADPAAGIVQIAPPSANNQGSANLDFPLKLPAGRKGMAPSLSVSYSSEGGDGWLGHYWNLSTPSISVETRWGVPRYDGNLETETYLMAGGQLTPVAHRGDWVERTADKQFYPQIEGAFNRIIRQGDHPSNYWWEITTQTGTKYYYGSEDGQNVSESYVMTDANGNIGEWKLAKVIDLNGNAITYNYQSPEYPTPPLSSGKTLYLKNINYTGFNGAQGKYNVDFVLQEETKTDATIRANCGYIESDGYLLDRVDISYDGSLIRSYELDYTAGAFNKTLLQKITELDPDGENFYSNTFEYYNETGNEYGFETGDSAITYDMGEDNLNGAAVLSVAKTTAINGSRNLSGGAGIYVGLGLGASARNKGGTVGASYSYTHSDDKGINTLIDLNGDRLVDKVFMDNRKLWYRPQLSAGGFGQPVKLSDDMVYQKTVANNHVIGFSANTCIGSVAISEKISRSKTKNYISDVNSDGLPDIIRDGKVYYNYIDDSGNPSFTSELGNLLIPTTEEGEVDSSLLVPSYETWEEIEKENPANDIVKVWVAPRDGLIHITGAIELLHPDSAAAYSSFDGVTASIQIETRNLEWTDSITAADKVSMDPGTLSTTIYEGQRVFFRLRTRFNGMFDQVKWDPQIKYVTEPEVLDVNGLSSNTYKASKGYLFSSDNGGYMLAEGQVHIRSVFSKPLTTDDLTVVYILLDTLGIEQVIEEKLFHWDEAIDGPILDTTVNVGKGDYLYSKVLSSTNIDWAAIRMTTKSIYTVSNDPEYAIGALKDTMYLAPYLRTFNKGRTISSPATAIPAYKTIKVTPFMSYGNDTISGSTVFSIKQSGKAPVKKTINVDSSYFVGDSVITYVCGESDNNYIEMHTLDQPVYDWAVDSAMVSWTDTIIIGRKYYINGEDTTVLLRSFALDTMRPYIQQGDTLFTFPGSDNYMEPIFTSYNKDSIFVPIGIRYAGTGNYFGPDYRCWGQFSYNKKTVKINVNDLTVEEPDDPDGTNISLDQDASFDENSEEFEDNPMDDPFIQLYANAMTGCWTGYDTLVFIGRDSMSCSRRGDKEILPYEEYCTYTVESSSKGRAIIKKSKISGESARVQAGVGGDGSSTSFSGSWTNTRIKLVTDFMDMNGDGYPDIVSEGKIQYTSPLGGLSSQTGGIDETIAFTHARTTGLGINNSDPSPKGNTNSKNSTPYAIGAGVLKQKTWDEYNVLDMNGDGLPDIVNENGEVRLNCGYTFSEPVDWGFEHVHLTECVDVDLSLGTSLGGGLSAGIDIDTETGELKGGSLQYSKCAGSVLAGVGANANESHPNLLFSDINGDGLADRIRTTNNLDGNLELISGDTPKSYVSLNTGAGFTEEFSWDNMNRFSSQYNINVQLNFAFTLGAVFWVPIPVKVVFTPSVEGSEGLCKVRESVMDFNGDGYPDYLTSNDDNTLKVQYSNIGKTNLLKQVNNALGNSFTLGYEQTENSFKMPNRKWVLTDVTTYDNHTGDGADYTKTSYGYGQGYYDRYERTFYGFDSLITKQIDTENGNKVYRSIVQTFANDNLYTRGMLLKEGLFDGQGNKFTETANTYMFRNVLTQEEISPAALPEFSSGETFFAYVAETNASYFEGQQQAGKTYRNSFEYDERGRITQYTDYGDEAAGDVVITGDVTYHNDNDNYIYVIPESIEVTSGGTLYRKRETDIDDKGNVIEVRKYIASDEFARYNLEYNDYGNIEKTEQPENANGERMSYEYTYDDNVQTYITKVGDAFGYSSTSEYDYKLGTVLETIDPNGHSMEMGYDNKGRLITVRGVKEIEEDIEFTIRHTYHPDAEVPWALTEHYDPANPTDFIETAIFTDGLGRTIQTKKDAAIYQDSLSPDKDMMVVSGLVVYDAFGRATEAYQPVLEEKGSTGTFNTNVDGIEPSRTEYDAMDRAVKTTLPDGSEALTSYGFGSDRDGKNQFMVTSTDPLLNSTMQYSDMRGRQTAVKMPDDIWLSTLFDPVGQVLEVTDHDGNITTSTYDLLGRRLERNHPDAGVTTWTFDRAGNVLTQQNAHTQQPITYSYQYNRLTDVTYPDNTYNNVHYTYGEPGAAENRAGRVQLVEDGTGAQLFSYGNMGEITQVTRAVVVPDNGTYAFKTLWEYDSWNRVRQIVYPDGEVVAYDYNSGGGLKDMKGEKGLSQYEYVKRIGYDKFGQRKYIAYGNNTQTSYSYDPYRRWLSNLQTATANGRTIQNNTYTYDAVGNIKQLANSAGAATDENLYGGPVTHNYTYDNRYQLKTASGTYTTSSKEYRYTLEMGYGNTGSILSKSQLNQFRVAGAGADDWTNVAETSYDYTYNYTSSKPHIVTSINNTSGDEDYVYQYDASGNNILSDEPGLESQRQIIWTEDNRIAAIKSHGNVSHYVYDATGERVLKLHSNSLSISINGVSSGVSEVNDKFTMYPNAYFVVKADQYTKHFYIENTRVLTKIGSNSVEETFFQGSDGSTGESDDVDYSEKQDNLESEVESNMNSFGLTWYRNSNGEIPSKYIKNYLLALELGNKVGSTEGEDYGGDVTDSLLAEDPTYEILQYYVHPDHLGSSTHITDINGEVYQHVEYLPWGEVFCEDRNTQQDRYQYLYNGKEMDVMTGLYYYGARYYDPRVGMFLGIDLLAEKYPGISGYAYVANNPINYIDPDGMKIGNPLSKYTRQYKQILKSTEMGRAMWKSLKQMDSKIYFHSMRTLSKEPRNLTFKEKLSHRCWNLPIHMDGYHGMTMSDTRFKHYSKTEDELDINVDLRFNPNTGFYETRPEHFKKQHIIINEPYTEEYAIDMTSMIKSINQELDSEFENSLFNSFYTQEYIQAIFEEVWHVIDDQNDMDLFDVKFNEDIHEFEIINSEMKNYEDQNFENKAHDKAEEGYLQYIDK